MRGNKYSVELGNGEKVRLWTTTEANARKIVQKTIEDGTGDHGRRPEA